ncbi:2-amino-4-hydroxy-6-hydroxymethyldihydropteridine diphosphokinase [Olivibacter sitiensis]|uniref:2-amino-4-hydroxy-6- hydroxymethyldihydropteridine diphosphokinase n=1 Tax=Olivibacter sitiensis TaxID=376470 RepID=UPI00040E4922|nr:2-amino-4-hydroxy-6-hydroxymethyldihydropteridine diphosphokinase [Olivibacter sitiensis]
MHQVFLLLGANLGDRCATLEKARTAIDNEVGTIIKKSYLYETQAWGTQGEEQPSYLNQVLELTTLLGPEQLLETTMHIEDKLGRTRKKKWESRLIDIDILFYDDLMMQSDTLTIPHPLLHKRKFTLMPLVEIAPDLVHPKFRKNITQLLCLLDDDLEVRMLDSSTS